MQVFGLLIREQIDCLFAVYCRVQHVRHIDIEVHLRHGPLATEEHEHEIP